MLNFALFPRNHFYTLLAFYPIYSDSVSSLISQISPSLRGGRTNRKVRPVKRKEFGSDLNTNENLLIVISYVIQCFGNSHLSMRSLRIHLLKPGKSERNVQLAKLSWLLSTGHRVPLFLLRWAHRKGSHHVHSLQSGRHLSVSKPLLDSMLSPHITLDRDCFDF